MAVRQFMVIIDRDEDPVLAKNRSRGSLPQTKGDFLNSFV